MSGASLIPYITLSSFIILCPHVFNIPYHLFARILLLQPITTPPSIYVVHNSSNKYIFTYSRILLRVMKSAPLGLDSGQFSNAQQWNNLPAHDGFLAMNKVINKVYTPWLVKALRTKKFQILCTHPWVPLAHGGTPYEQAD